MGFKSRAKKLKKAADAARPNEASDPGKKSGTVRCEVSGCKNWADKSMGGRRIAYDRAADVWGEHSLSSDSRRISICKTHYKEWKKARRDDPDEWS